MRPGTFAAVLAAGLALLPAAVQAQGGLARRVEGAGDGEVRMSFAAREGVCGYENGIGRTDREGRQTFRHGRFESGWEREPCLEGPVHVALRVEGGRVTDVETRVGRPPRDRGRRVTDLGRVGAPEAARYLLSLAERGEGGSGDDAVLPAILADSVEVWPELLRLARSDRLANGTRRSARFWLGQAAADAATRGLRESADNAETDVRKQAVFALSQRPREESVPELVRLARTHRDPEIRRTALFWLGQTSDERALDLFEEILRGR